MQRAALIFEHSPYFLLLCVLAGAAYAFLQYKKSGPWGAVTNKFLFALRMLTVGLIATLLVSPILRQIQNYIEEPALVFAIDNSLSVAEVMDSTWLKEMNKEIKQLTHGVEDRYQIEYRDLSGGEREGFPDIIIYDAQSTDFSSLFADIRGDYEGRNLAGVVLVSDGIYNKGVSPTFSDYNFDIYTVGIGDTVPKSDLSIVSLLYNKISYEGNKFPLIAQISHLGFSGKNVQVSVIKDGQVIDRQLVSLGTDNQVKEVKFLIEANESGYQRYQVLAEKKEGEFTYTNNIKQAYIEVVEGKEQIALVAPAPHPDIKALKAAIESNANYSIDQFILSMEDNVQKLIGSGKKYDLVIFHQMPDRRGIGREFTKKFLNEGTSTLTIFGTQTHVQWFNQLNNILSIDAIPNEYDQVTAAFNQGFNSFKLSDKLQQSLDGFPPMIVPFGKINLSGQADILLHQRVGNVTTSKPLIAVRSEGERKTGVILGEGLWKWKLMDYAQNDNNEAFHELITKIVQYLSSKEDKRKFKAYPVKSEFLINKKVVFDAEVYNDLYERVYGNKIDLKLTDAEGNQSGYSYVTNENNTRYAISGLSEGVYQYEASTTLGQQKETVKGEFLVKELQLENINLTADFNLLRTIADKSGGSFAHINELEKLKIGLTTKEAQGIIHTNERYLPFIHIKWLFFLLLVLLSAEWFIRKYNGSY